MDASYQIPPLTGELIEQIIYAMENQNEIAVLNLAEGIVTFQEDSSGMDSTVELPRWSSADGFDLMVRFASRNRAAELKRALSQGRGVFRAFKDVLDRDPALKQRWHSFKRHEMEKVVTAWYRQLRKREGGHEGSPEMADVLLEDFSVVFSDTEPDDAKLLEALGRDGYVPLSPFQDASFVSLLSPDNSLVGMLVYRKETGAWHVVYYGVDAPWRGLGLFRLMFESLLSRAAKANVARLLFDSVGESMGVGSMFEGVDGVHPVSMTLEIPTSQYLSRKKPLGEGVPSPYL
jgi:hypothetical protein